MKHVMSREIGIDAGHRVMTHGSKCKNLHGHRYKIEAVCEADILIDSGEQEAMVLDFGFMKSIMMDKIDHYCDHGMIMYYDDPLLYNFGLVDSATHIKTQIHQLGWYFGKSTLGKIYIVDFIPTAEMLAQHWFERMVDDVDEQSNGVAKLKSVIVHETPNCKATYHG